ncbi:uncharacterized protein METZ01_LOCUS153573 [marine metagenome]|uniref:Uncharacterized protein n=1 Tax=marine metagenome TaxID=408172 RepID=A0A382AH58_9ZZZZ
MIPKTFPVIRVATKQAKLEIAIRPVPKEMSFMVPIPTTVRPFKKAPNDPPSITNAKQ